MGEVFEVGPCNNAYEMGFLIGKRFSNIINRRLSNDTIFKSHLLPFSSTPEAGRLIEAFSQTNRTKYPNYWDELRGTADGSGAPFRHILLLNFRKEILPLIDPPNCSDALLVSDTLAIAAHNEDANPSIVGHTYIVKAVLPNGASFTGYTYAGELPSCAFGFNSNGVVFTLDSVPPTRGEIVSGRVGRNFVSRDLLEAEGIDDAVRRIEAAEVSVGHSYNLMDVKKRKVLNVETASRGRVSIREVGTSPFFHGNMYLHLGVDQVHDENSAAREARAKSLPMGSKEEMLSLMGDTWHHKYPIYMAGPTLCTLCTVLVDLDGRYITIFQGNPKDHNVSHVFSLANA